jgi:hypothetical protein
MSSHLVSTIRHIVPICLSRVLPYVTQSIAEFCTSKTEIQDLLHPIRWLQTISSIRTGTFFRCQVSARCVLLFAISQCTPLICTVHSISLHTASNAPTLATPYCRHLESLSYLSTFFIPSVRFINSHAHHHCHYKSSRAGSTDHGGHGFKQLLPLHYPGKWIMAMTMGWNRWLCISVTLISWQYSTRL